MKIVCNANCSWCVSKSNNKSKVPEKLILNQDFINNFQKSLKILSQYDIKKLEFTGGGEPFLNQSLQEIIDYVSSFFPLTYKKLYTNGFIHKEISGIDELNISRSHFDSILNNTVYRSPLQNDLKETISFFRPYFKTIRTCTVLQKGLIDTPEKALEMIEFLPEVDQLVFRPLIPETLGHDHVKVDFDILHPKALKDTIDCTCHKSLVLAPDGNLYYDFNLTQAINEQEL